MRNILIMFFCALNTLASATNYYVSSEGNDSATGTSETSPWKTIAKVNSVFSSMKPGDRILFRRGDTFYGTLLISAGGISGNPIVISAYGTGEKPVITGFSNITTWTNTGNGIYSKVVTCASSPEMVLINGVQYARGRWPNSKIWPETSTWASVDSYSGYTSLTDAELGNTSINWKGAEVVIRATTYNNIPRHTITDHTGNTLTYSGGTSTYHPGVGWGYFIQNDLRTLDSFGEWFYNKSTSTFYMYFGTTNPSNYSVQVSSLNDLVLFTSYKHYVTFDNISFKGANNSTIECFYNDYIYVQNCDIQFSGWYGISAGQSKYMNISNCTFDHCNDNALFTYSYCNNLYFGYNTVTNTGLIPGMGQGKWQSGKAVMPSQSDDIIVEYNKILNSGYTGIQCGGNNQIIRYNFVNTFGFNKEDCGGIQYSAGNTYKNIQILNNIILYGMGNSGGKPAGQYDMVAGIFFDYYSVGPMTISNNSVANMAWCAYFTSGSQKFTITNNTFYNARYVSRIAEFAEIPNPLREFNINGNIYFAKTASQFVMQIVSQQNDFNQIGIFNNNYYARPLDNAKPIVPSVNWSYTPKTLEEWRALSGQDLNSKISPITLTDTSDIDFYYNTTKTDKIVTLPKPMIDVKGTKYSGSITLAPFTSAVLMVDPNPTEIPVPVYVSSAVENIAPAIVDMFYSINLASITPSKYAFTVMANGVNKDVYSVSVSGSRVRLILTSNILSGENVTVSYTRPAENPLQSTTGGLAASISSQPVTNNIIPTASGGTIPVYVSSVLENTTPDLIEMSYNIDLANIVPDVSAFSIWYNSVPKTIKSVAVSGSKVLLTLPEPVRYGSTIITVAYTKPANNPLQSTSGGLAATLSPQSVTNKVTTSVIPVYVSSIIENYAPDIIEMYYDTELANVVPDISAFSIWYNSVPKTIKSVAVSGNKVLLTLPDAIRYGSTVITVAYTRPANNPLQSISGGLAATLSPQVVTNDVTTNIIITPVYQNSVIQNVTPSLIEMNYDTELANIIPDISAFSLWYNSVPKTISSVSVSGNKVLITLPSPILYGSTQITIAYTKPSINPLQSTSGGLAATLSPQVVTNLVTTKVIPVYVSSVIENLTPDIIEINYNTTLANIIPDISAFSIWYNSVPKTISSVSISGNKVLLKLPSPILYSSTIVTVAYTRPAINALQSISGGLAETLGPQTVTNNINLSKSASYSLMAVNYEESAYSGFVYEIDASGIYGMDINKTSYFWSIPDNVSVSSTSEARIRFLSPVVKEEMLTEFHLTVDDGTYKKSLDLPVIIKPYKPEAEHIRIAKSFAGDYYMADRPGNISDNNTSTKWSSKGDNQSLLMQLDNPSRITHLQIAFTPGQKYESYFDIYGSPDNIDWEPVLIKEASCNFSGDFQVFNFPSVKTESEFRYIKLIGHGNAINDWNVISEIRIYGYPGENQNLSLNNTVNISLYPNPAKDFINIQMDPSESLRIIRIYDLQGRMCLENRFDPYVSTNQIPVNLNPGVYFVRIIQGTTNIFSQKIVICK